MCARLSRRALARAAWGAALASAWGAASSGCGTVPPPPPKSPPLPSLRTGSLAELLPEPGLVWAVRARPRAIAQIAWLIPRIAAFAPEERLDRFLGATGVDLRQATEAWFATYDLGRGACSLQVFRHAADPALIERKFRERLTDRVERVVDRPDVVRLGGGIGAERHVMLRLGRDVVAFERGATVKRGVSALLAARAQGRLGNVDGIEKSEPLGALLRRFGDAPVVAVAPGPIDANVTPAEGAAGAEGRRSELAGLLSIATGVGVGVRPTAREGIGAAFAVAGPFGDRSAEASEVLKRAWAALQRAEIGRMLTLDRERDPAIATHADDTAALAVELDAGSFTEGLRKVTDLDLRALLE